MITLKVSTYTKDELIELKEVLRCGYLDVGPSNIKVSNDISSAIEFLDKAIEDKSKSDK